jgi:hypothetical protein
VGEFRAKTAVKRPVDSAFVNSGPCSDFACESGGCRKAIERPVGGRILVSSMKRRPLLDAYRLTLNDILIITPYNA